MIRGFYTAKTGLMAQQTNMDTVANNLANVNTVGYKPMKVSFTDLMYQNLNAGREEANSVMVGHGVKVNKSDLIMSPGGLQATNYAYDFSIVDNDGFFAIQTATGDIQYTRAGNFILSNDDDTFYLCAANGDRVLDEDGAEIEVEFRDGEEDGEEYGWFLDQELIGVYRFPNPTGLMAVGNNRFVETENSGEAEAVESPNIINGYLESSAVDTALEMTKVIEASKAFSFNSRMVQVADEVEQTINQLR